MRFYYLDPGLQNDVGHHANTCRTVTSELRRHGIETIVAGSIAASPALKAELGVLPFFSFYTYRTGNDDPMAGWVAVLLQGVAATTHELARLPAPTAEDVVFLNSAMPVQLMSVISWLNGIPREHRPRVVVEFGTNPGVEAEQVGDTFNFRATDPRRDPRSVLYRYIGLTTPDELRERLVLMTFDPLSSLGYEFIIGHKTGVLPFLQGAYMPPRRKIGKRPITIGVLGHQRDGKGYELMPDVISALHARHREAIFLLHNATPGQMPSVQKAIRDAAARTFRVIVDERPADDRLWRYLFAGTDIVLCPYDPAVYRLTYSAIAVEALANGLPIVAPAGTSLSRFMEEHGGAIATFANFNRQEVAVAASQAIDAYDALSEKAFAAAEVWNRQDRKALLVDRILGRA